MKYKKKRKRESRPAFWTEQHSLVHTLVSPIDPSLMFLDVISEVDLPGLNHHFHWAFPLRHTD